MSVETDLRDVVTDTLRDEFAGQAMCSSFGLLLNDPVMSDPVKGSEMLDGLAVCAYRMADAMLRARLK